MFALSVIYGTENVLFIWCADVSRLKPLEIFLKIASPFSYQTILPYIFLTPYSLKLLWYGGLYYEGLIFAVGDLATCVGKWQPLFLQQ